MYIIGLQEVPDCEEFISYPLNMREGRLELRCVGVDFFVHLSNH